MSEKKFEIFIADNFKLLGKEECPSESYLQRSDVYFDTRTMMVTHNADFSNLEWYYNYIETNAVFASKNPKAYPSYLLNLGFIPIVFLPSCCQSYSVLFQNAMDVKNLPYIKTKAFSFVMQHTDMDVVDIWMSKMDINRIFGIPIEQIRSVDVIRRILDE